MFQTKSNERATVEIQDLESNFARHLDPVYRFLYRRVGNQEDAEELTYRVFLQASQHLDSRKVEPSTASLLLIEAKLTVADHWRRYYRASLRGHSGHAPSGDDINGESREELARVREPRVDEVLQGLPPEFRRVLELRFVEGDSVDEAAVKMGMTAIDLKALQLRALAAAAKIGFPAEHEDGVFETHRV